MNFNEDIEPGLRIVVIFIFLLLIGLATGDFQCLGDAEAQDKPLKFPPRMSVWDPPGLSQEEAEYLSWKMRKKMIDDDTFYGPVIVEMLLNLYRGYSAECYSDSTLIITGGGPEIHTPVVTDSLGRKVIDMTGVYFQNAVYVITRKWTHKEPTLPGFMAWLEKKYEVK